MKGVDIYTYDFDFDLTYAVLLMHGDGTILTTYAGRDFTGTQSHQSASTFKTVLEQTVRVHAQHKPRPPVARFPWSVEKLPWMRRRPKQPTCYHCHNVHDALLGEKRHQGTFKRADAWRWPDPRQIGLELARDDQTRITAITKDSPAAKAGLAVGDRLVRVGGRPVLTFGDVQRVLHETAEDASGLPVVVRRKDKTTDATLHLAAAWKTPTPLVFSWRASKWALSPKPGFGGRPLDATQKTALGIDPAQFAFRITYLVTWGERAYTGQNAVRAGLRKGDVVTSVGGKHDFASMDHFHAWFRLTRTPGSTVAVTYLRGKDAHTAKLAVLK